MAGPAEAAGLAEGVMLNCRATAGVTPTVAAVGVMGGRNCARARANWSGASGRALAATGADCAIAVAGTTVAPPRLMKFCTTTWLLVMFVTLWMLVLVMTWLMLRMFGPFSRRT
jgi:hypothetical protein